MSKTEGLLAGLLRYGTCLASGVTGSGLAMSLVGLAGEQVVAAGVVLFLSLPVLRVLVMFAVFMRDRDYRLATVAAIVLMTIVVGFAIGIYTSNPRRLTH
jgi:uncharacterized membrane protein